MPVNLDRRRHQRQRRRGAHGVEVEHGAFDRQVGSGSKQHVRRDGVHLDRAGVERLVIKRIQAVLDVVEDKVVTHDGTRGRKRRGAHVAAVVAEGQIDSVGATDLVRLVVDAVERTGRNAVHRRNFNTGLHENVEHAGGKLPTKTATLQDERDLAGVLCLIFCSHIDLLRLRFDFLLPSFGMEGAWVLELRGRLAESTSRSEGRFRDALSAWVAMGKACPTLRLDSGSQLPLEASSGKCIPFRA